MEIKANYAEMEVSASKIISAANAYRVEVKNLYNDIDNLNNVWKGTDNLEYVNKVNSYKDDINTLGEVVENYGKFLNRSAQIIKGTQNDIAANARRL